MLEAPSPAPPRSELEAELAERLEAEAAIVAANPAAALAWAVAGLLHRAGGPVGIVLPVAHRVRLEGARLDRLVALGGGRPVEVGTVGDCPEPELSRALAEAAAGLLVVGGGTREVVPPARFLWLCRQAGRPALLVDREGDLASGRLAAWADGGAALLVADGRTVAGIEAGILAGTAAAIDACRRAEAAAAAFRAPQAARSALASALAARQQA